MNKEEMKEFLALMNLANKTADELIAIYNAWDYKYKPKYSCFLHEVVVSSQEENFVKYLLYVRNRAYYTQNSTECDYAFNVLACLIQIAIIAQIETPFDHVIKSDKDFEYKLNHLHLNKET